MASAVGASDESMGESGVRSFVLLVLFTALLCNGSLLLPASAPLLEMGEKPRGSDESGPNRSPLPASFRTLEAPSWRLEGFG